MTTDPKTDLHRLLNAAREALLWKLDGLSERDVRRPLTPTGTNLLGLVKHSTTVEMLYFGLVFDRFFPEPVAWFGQDVPRNTDMWATEDESRDDIVALHRRVSAHSDATILELDLDATGIVPWFPPGRNTVTLHHAMVHVLAELNRHTGHADIVRELVDGSVGQGPPHDDGGNDNDVRSVAPGDETWWHDYRDRLERVADSFAES